MTTHPTIAQQSTLLRSYAAADCRRAEAAAEAEFLPSDKYRKSQVAVTSVTSRVTTHNHNLFPGTKTRDMTLRLKLSIHVRLMIDIYVYIDATVDTQTTIKLLTSSGLCAFSQNLLVNCCINVNINVNHKSYVYG